MITTEHFTLRVQSDLFFLTRVLKVKQKAEPSAVGLVETAPSLDLRDSLDYDY